ncbi:hypothetical protein HDU67_003131 [Dinochytrium kinnereticum]|nr:hypothetical protein HDU67_003131 [Dinochytrium kinnereticum]
MITATITESSVVGETPKPTVSGGSPRFTIRKSGDRGAANHGWLDTKLTFSFAGYYDHRFEGFGPLRVLNEDKVSPINGFGAHPHREYEIFSYIVSGFLSHRDSMGNVETLPRGCLQFTSAGTGIIHSEMNTSRETPVHFLQLWAKPQVRGLKPSYSTIFVPDEVKIDAVRPVPLMVPSEVKQGLGEDGFRGAAAKNLIGIHQDLYMFAAILNQRAESKHRVVGEDRIGYVHVVMSGNNSAVEVSTGDGKVTARLEEGDGLFINDLGKWDELIFQSVGDGKAEFIFLDMTGKGN